MSFATCRKLGAKNFHAAYLFSAPKRTPSHNNTYITTQNKLLGATTRISANHLEGLQQLNNHKKLSNDRSIPSYKKEML